MPSSLAILNDACAHDFRLRAQAIGIWTAAGGAAIAAGPVIGGFLLTGLGWRSIFLVNIPICWFGLGLTLRFVPPTQREKKKHRSFDPGGQALAIVALTSLICAVIEARPLGLTHPIVAVGSLLALGASAAFIAVEARTAAPMLPLHFFRRPGFTPAIVFGILVNCTYYGIIFVLSLYLQKALGYSTVQAGLAFLPLTGTFIASNIASGWIAGRIGSRAPMILGGLIGALGYALLARLGSRSTFFDMLPGFVLIPAGIGLAVPAMTTAILSHGSPTWAFQSSVEEVATAPNKHIEPERKVAVRKPACEGALYRRVSPESYRYLARFCFCIFCAVRALGTLGSSACVGSLVACVFGGSFWEPLAGLFCPRFTGGFVDLAEAEEKCEFGDRHNFAQRKVLRKRTGLTSFTVVEDILTAVKSVCILQSSLFEAH